MAAKGKWLMCLLSRTIDFEVKFGKIKLKLIGRINGLGKLSFVFLIVERKEGLSRKFCSSFDIFIILQTLLMFNIHKKANHIAIMIIGKLYLIHC